MELDAFYRPDGEDFLSTELTRGPWSPMHQHGGPPAALLARAIERAAGDRHVARLTVEFLRPIPIGRLTVSTDILQQGRKVLWIDAVLRSDSAELARARAVCTRKTDFDEADFALQPRPPVPAPLSPDRSQPIEFPFFDAPIGYHKAMELRFTRGAFGDGVSACLEWKKWTFVNPDLTISLHRPLEGEWVCLEATTTPDTNGVGLAETRLWDTRGMIGRGVQSLLIDRRV